jgi:hypothetical protein
MIVHITWDYHVCELARLILRKIPFYELDLFGSEVMERHVDPIVTDCGVCS